MLAAVISFDTDINDRFLYVDDHFLHARDDGIGRMIMLLVDEVDRVEPFSLVI